RVEHEKQRDRTRSRMMHACDVCCGSRWWARAARRSPIATTGCSPTTMPARSPPPSRSATPRPAGSTSTASFRPKRRTRGAGPGPDFAVVGAPSNRFLPGKLFLAAPQLDQLKEVTLRAKANGLPLPPITWRTPGQQTYVKMLPRAALDRPVRLELSVDYPF